MIWEVHRLKTQGWHSSTTTVVSFNDSRVPAVNLLGAEGEGFLPIMNNFNNERFAMSVAATRMSRICLEDAIAYGKTRKTFGKPLMKHQVLRHKAMDMARAILAAHALNMEVCRVRAAGSANVHGITALQKVQATRTLELCAREASQVIGGRAYLREGPGARIERIYREVRVYAIGGGSEEVMTDLAGRMAKL